MVLQFILNEASDKCSQSYSPKLQNPEVEVVFLRESLQAFGCKYVQFLFSQPFSLLILRTKDLNLWKILGCLNRQSSLCLHFPLT